MTRKLGLCASKLACYMPMIAVMLVAGWAIFFVITMIPWLEAIQQNIHHFNEFPLSLRIAPADTAIYYAAARELSLSELPINLLGPTLVYKIFSMNIYQVAVFNLISLVVAVTSVLKLERNVLGWMAICVLINPFLMMNLLTANKELYGAICFLYLYGVQKWRSPKLVALAFLYAVLSKYQLVVFTLFGLLLIGAYNDKFRYLLTAAFVLMMTVLPRIETLTYAQMTEVLAAASDGSGYSLVELLHTLNVGYYALPLTVAPKTLLYLLDGGAYFFLLHAVMGVAVVLKPGDRVFKLIVLNYLVFISAIPFVQYRYIGIIYLPLVIMVMSGANCTFFGVKHGIAGNTSA